MQVTLSKLLQGRAMSPVSDRWPATYKSYVLIIVISVKNIGQTLKSYALSLNSPHQSNYAPKLRLTHHMHITQPNTCSVIYPDNPVHKSAKTCTVLSCSSDRACAHVLWWRYSQPLGSLSVWHLWAFICVSIIVMYKLMSGWNTNEWATFGQSQSTGQGQGRDVISGHKCVCVCVCVWGFHLI